MMSELYEDRCIISKKYVKVRCSQTILIEYVEVIWNCIHVRVKNYKIQ